MNLGDLSDEDVKPFHSKRPSPDSVQNVTVCKRVPKTARRGLACRNRTEMNPKSEPESSGSNVYTSQISIFRQQKKTIEASCAAQQLEALNTVEKENKDKRVSLDESNAVDEVADSPDSSSNFDTPPSPPISRKKHTQSKKLSKLIRNLEQEQLSYRVEKAANRIENNTSCDENSDIEVICGDEEDKAPRTIPIRIQILHRIIKSTIATNVNFSKVFDDLSSTYEINRNRILLTLNDTQIHESDTPQSIGLSVADIIEFGIMDDVIAEQIAKDEAADTRNTVLLKVQAKNTRIKLEIRIKNNDRMEKLMETYASETGTDLASLIFKFDGDQIEPNDTPESLELEDGFCIDAIVHS